MFIMKFLFVFFAICFGFITFAQQRLQFESLTKENQEIIDSLYRSDSKYTLKDLESKAKTIHEKLLRKGYFNARISPKISKDSLFVFQVNLGKKTQYLKLMISKEMQEQFELKPFEIVKICDLELFISKIQKEYDQMGFSFHQLKLRNFKMQSNEFIAELYVHKSEVRLFNEFVFQGIDNFPKNLRKHIYKSYQHLPFSEQNIINLTKEINLFNFCQLVKAPEVLFSKDSTKVYLTLEKKKNNQFDGYAGFSTDENDNLKINGYLDLVLSNLLANGENIKIFWRNNGEKQTEFQAKLELPYLFGSKFTSTLELNILQQDSTFQNASTKVKFGYHLKYNQKIFIGYENNSSSNISKMPILFLSDFNSNHWLISFTNYPAFMQPFLRDEQLFMFSEIGYGQRKNDISSTQQFKIKVDAEKNFSLAESQNLWLKSDNYFLLSDNYLVNELYRFGGHQSLRGFLDNSLQANQYHALLSEYQYFFNPNFYLHSVSDFAFYKDNASNLSKNLITAGLGFGLQTKNGMIKFNYVNPVAGFSSFQWSNSLVHLQFKAVF